MKPLHLHCEIYGQRIFFFYEWSPRKFNNYMKKHYKWDKNEVSKSDDAGTWQMGDPNDGQDDFIVWVRKGAHEPMSCLVHELIHLKNRIFKHVGHVQDLENDETEAYYVQRLYKFVVSNGLEKS